MSELSSSDCQQFISQSVEELKSKVDIVFNDKITILEKELDFVSKNIKSKSEIINSIKGPMNKIKGLTQNIDLNDSSIMGKLDKIMSILYKIDDVSKMFGNSKSIFEGLKSAISSKFQEDNRTLWNILDYAKRSMITRVDLSLNTLTEIESTLNIYIARYNNIDIEKINLWIDSQGEIFKNTLKQLEESKIEALLAKEVSEKNQELSDYHLDKSQNFMRAGIDVLKGTITTPDSFYMISLQNELINLFNKFTSEANYLISLKQNGGTLSTQINEIDVNALASIDVLDKTINGIKAIIVNIKQAKINYENSDVAYIISTGDWILQLEILISMLNYTATTDMTPDPTGDDLLNVNELTDIFNDLNIEEEIPYILNDIAILSNFLNEIFKGNTNKVDITNLTNRLHSNIDSVKNELIELKNKLKSSLPETSNNNINSLIASIRKNGFDNWINTLLKGDIQGFLNLLFDESSQAGLIIKNFNTLSNCNVDLTPYKGLFRAYEESIRAMTEKASEGIKEISQIKDIIPQNLKMQTNDLKVIKKITEQDIQFMTNATT